MKITTKENFYSEYLTYKNLTPNKTCQTSLAMKEASDGNFYWVILKDINTKQALIYDALSHMWNPHIADTYEVFSISDHASPDTCHYVAITEYVSAANSPQEECLSLTEFVHKNGPLSDATALSICIQICKGLKEFHEKGFVHRDLKPDNIMISKYDLQQPEIKIIDFGSAKEMEFYKPADTTVIGTLGYQSPESLSTLTTNQSDIYSIGCILNFMLTGQEPGIQTYSENHYIVNIIEKATYVDAAHRYKNVVAMQKDLEHELHMRFWDKIPFLRALPGFRTHTLWKEIIALFFYITILFLTEICIILLEPAAILKIFLFYILMPLIFIFNIGNLLRFFPQSIRQNYHLFYMVRMAMVLSSMFFPLIYAFFV